MKPRCLLLASLVIINITRSHIPHTLYDEQELAATHHNMSVEVGTILRVTLVSDVTVEGCLFSLDESTGTLVLMELPRAATPAAQATAVYANPNVHVINGQFVKSVVALPFDGSRLMPLPRSVLDSLPVAENGDIKKLMNKLKSELKKRQNLYHDSASIDACDTFEFFLKLYPDLKWSTDPAHLSVASASAKGADVKLVLIVSGSILLSGNADVDNHSWRRPKVVPLGKDASTDLLERISKQAQACAERFA